MKFTQNNSTTIVREGRLTLTGDDIIALLWAVNPSCSDVAEWGGAAIPKEAEVTFHVPSGGDWSNQTLDINEQHPVTISWSTTEETPE